MRPSGFIRNVILLALTTWFFTEIVVKGGAFIQTPETQQFACSVMYGIAGWGVMTLLARESVQSAREKEGHDDTRDHHE